MCHFFVATQAIILEMHQKVLYIIYSPEIEQLEPKITNNRKGKNSIQTYILGLHVSFRVVLLLCFSPKVKIEKLKA